MGLEAYTNRADEASCRNVKVTLCNTNVSNNYKYCARSKYSNLINLSINLQDPGIIQYYTVHSRYTSRESSTSERKPCISLLHQVSIDTDRQTQINHRLAFYIYFCNRIKADIRSVHIQSKEMKFVHFSVIVNCLLNSDAHLGKLVPKKPLRRSVVWTKYYLKRNKVRDRQTQNT